MVHLPTNEGEGEVQVFIADWWRKRGIEPDIEQLRSHPAFVEVEYDYHDRPIQVE